MKVTSETPRERIEKFIFRLAWKIGNPSLFRWLIQKHWIFPEPQVFSNSKYISELMQMKGDRYLVQEMMRILADDCSRIIFENWQKHSYFVFEPIEVFTRQRFEDNSFEVRYKFISKYSYGIGVRDLEFIADQIKKLSAFTST
jgi:hypothetical protein